MTRQQPSEIDGLAMRAKLGRHFLPPERWGNGWRLHSHEPETTVIVTIDEWISDHTWLHASMSHPGWLPSYDEVKALHAAVFGDGWAYMPFAPPAKHINDHEYCLHLWGRQDKTNVLPDFTHGLGSI